MKTLFALLLLAIALGAGYWKTRFPDATVNDLRTQASSTMQRLKGGLVAVRDGNPNSVNGKVRQSLSARLDTIETQLKSTRSAGGNKIVQGRLTDSERKHDAVDARLADFTQQIDSLTGSRDKLNARLENIDGRLDLTSRRLEELSKNADTASLLTRINTLDSSLKSDRQAAAQSRNEFANQLSVIAERAETLDNRVYTMAGTDTNTDGVRIELQTSLDNRLALLEKKLVTTKSDSKRLTQLAGQLESIREKLNALDARGTDTDTTVASLSGTLNELKTTDESVSIDSMQSDIREQLASLQSQVESDGDANVASLNKSLDATRNRVQMLEQRVIDLPASSSAADSVQENQSALEAQIAALSRKIEDMQTDVSPELATSLSEVQEQVNKLTSKRFVTQEDLRAQQEGRTVEYKIYFDRNSTQVSEAASRVLDSFITQEQNRTSGVSIFGFTDRSGAAGYNQQLALQRASNVRSYLVKNGFDYTKIQSLSGLGEDAASAVLDDEVEDAQQRVVVLYASQP